MKYRLSSISILQTAKVVAVLYGLLGLFMIPFGCAALAIDSNNPGQLFVGYLYLLSPLIYAILGFIGAALGAWLYNLIARQMGGIEFTLDQASS